MLGAFVPVPRVSKGRRVWEARMRATGSRARTLSLCCLLCAASCGHRRERALDVSDVLPGKWVQVWPVAGALDTLEFRSNGDVDGGVRGLWLPFTHREHLTWRTDFPFYPGGLCISEGPWTAGVRGISCDGFRIAADTLLLARGARYMRLRPGGPAIVAWSGPWGFVAEPAPGESAHALAPPPRSATVGAIRDTTGPQKAEPQ